jgi:4-amino-4-deoxychorismate lyase
MSSIVYLNENFLPENEAFIPISDRGFLFGDGVFTTIKIKEGYPAFFERHIEKLARDCKMLGISPKTISEKTVRQLIEKNQANKGEWRLKIILSGGIGSELNLKNRSEGIILMILKPYKGNPSTMRLCCYPNPIFQPLGNVKSLAYLSRLAISDYAIKKGFDDALVLNSQGVILDTSIANFFWKTDKQLLYPDPMLEYYQGITLQVVLENVISLGYTINPIRMKLEEIPDDAFLYLCNSMKGVLPVISIGSKTYGRDEVFEHSISSATVHRI